MIGFDEFIILNDNSTDDTQCLLDAYAAQDIVKLVPQDIPDILREDATSKMKAQNDRVFDICAKHLASSDRKTWMLAHDVDEFLWIRDKKSLQQVVKDLTAPGKYASLYIPRLLFGSSFHESYDDRLVMERFTRRFEVESCDNRKGQQQQQRRQQQHGHRRLFNQRRPTSYCEEKPKRTSSIDYRKVMSLASALAQTCIGINRQAGNPVLCHGSHRHVLRNQKNESDNVKRFSSQERMKHPRTLWDLQDRMFIMHYMTKSREEFYHRSCSSVWRGKYFQCPDCTAESYFNLTEEYANNYEDTRMLPLAKQLRQIMESSSSIGATCDTSFKPNSAEYYQACFQDGMHQRQVQHQNARP